MSSFLYRPTPVVNLGNGAFASTRVMGFLPGATMRGIPAGASALGKAAPTGASSRMRRVDTRYQPWLKTSGTMGSFLPNGLGQDDGSGIDWSTIDVSPTPPVSALPDLVPPDLGSPSFNPNIPVSIGPTQPPPPPAGAGPTGTGIPGTRPLNPATQAVGVGTGLLNTVKNFFAPSAPPAPAGYKALPGYGGAPVVSGGTSWFSQKTILPQLGSNGLVLAVGVGLLLMLGGGGYAAGRSR
jgi:hypothetical protein